MESGVPKYFLLTLIVMTILVLVIPVLLFYYLPDMVIMLYLPWVCISTWMVEKMESILYKSNKDSKVDSSKDKG